MNKLIIIFLIWLSLSYNTSCILDDGDDYSCPQFEPFCTCSFLSILCDNITQFNELNFKNFSCSSISISLSQPAHQIILNNDFKLDELDFSENSIHLSISNLKGIEYKANPFNLNRPDIVNLELIDSFLDIYSRDDLLGLKICDNKLLSEFNSENLFKNINELIIHPLNRSNIICPVLFKNAYINSLSVINNFNFEFYKLPETELNCTINNLNLDFVELFLDSKLLDSMIFSQLIRISIMYSKLEGIQKDLFYSFKKLKTLILFLDNFDQLYKNGIEWMHSLNSDVYVDLTNENEIQKRSKEQFTLFISDSKDNFYLKNDTIEQFCIFKDFPHEKLVFPIIETNGEDLPCSCVVIWLIKYRKYYNGSYSNDMNSDSVSHCYDSLFDQNYNACNFEQKLNDCELLSEKNRKITFLTILIGAFGGILVFLLLVYTILTYKYFTTKNKGIKRSNNEELGFSPLEMVIDE